MGYMDGSYDETVREAEEGSGLLRSGLRFLQEKRQRTGESNVATETRGHEIRSKGMDKPYNDEGDE